MIFLKNRRQNNKEEQLLHEEDAKRNLQIEQLKGIIGYFYRMYINDSRDFALSFKGKKILDIGAGDGLILEGCGLDPIEMDISMQRCIRLKRIHNNIICASGYHIPIKDNSVDCTLLIAILEHTTEPRLIIEEIYRVLKEGGQAAILIPNDIMMSLGRLVLFKFPPRYPSHITFVTPKRLKRWLSGRFQILKEYNLPFHRVNFFFSLYYFAFIKKI